MDDQQRHDHWGRRNPEPLVHGGQQRHAYLGRHGAEFFWLFRSRFKERDRNELTSIPRDLERPAHTTESVGRLSVRRSRDSFRRASTATVVVNEEHGLLGGCLRHGRDLGYGSIRGGLLGELSRSVTMNSIPSAVITADASVRKNRTDFIASVPDAGTGASYTWTISKGSISSGAGTARVTYTSGSVGTLGLRVTVRNSSGCSVIGTKNVTVTN